MSEAVLPVLQYEQHNELEDGIYGMLQIAFALHSNRISGSRLSSHQVEYLFYDNTMDGNARLTDFMETLNHFRCFDYILDTVEEPITEEYVKALHGMLKSGIWMSKAEAAIIGDYKQQANTFLKHRTSEPEQVSEQMAQLLREYDEKKSMDLYDIAAFHVAFMQIHPFHDGNGRIGRLLMLKQCLAHRVVPFCIQSECGNFYHIGMRNWMESGNPMRLLEVFQKMQEDMKTLCGRFQITCPTKSVTAKQLLDKHGIKGRR